MSNTIKITDAVRVKPLLWEKTWDGSNEDIPGWRARDILGLSVWFSTAGVQFDGRHADTHEDVPHEWLAARMAEKEELYAARILSALEPAPDAAIRAAALEEAEGPQHRELLTCKGCKHFVSNYWREPSGDGETYDSGTDAKCLKVDRWITSYYGSEPAPPKWCPVLELKAAAIRALIEPKGK